MKGWSTIRSKHIVVRFIALFAAWIHTLNNPYAPQFTIQAIVTCTQFISKTYDYVVHITIYDQQTVN
jgi:hypothetical protein